jgi:tRNA(fMet)-specific endonuclease VapC
VKYLLDTNIVSYLMRGSHPQLMARIGSQIIGDVGISVVCAGELWHGLSRRRGTKIATQLEASLKNLLSNFVICPLPVNAGKIYGEIFADLEIKGHVIGANDLWIAAHGLAIGATLVTNNVDEFSRVAGLRIENWTE